MRLTYRGRFAPSPTGPLHFGSLVAAVGSYLDARASGGEWLVRMEDLDRSRCRPEYDTSILKTLESFGFAWDGTIMRQSERNDVYLQALDGLIKLDLAYPCACSRKEISDFTLSPDGAHIYPGTCSNGLPEGKKARSWRMRVYGDVICFNDLVQGKMSQSLQRDIGDFVLFRADGYFSYQLAVVVDDEEQKITRVVRGADLLDSTPRQIYLQYALGYTFPEHAHLPVATNKAGNKLSKQTRARPLDDANPVPELLQAFEFLGMSFLKNNNTTLADLWNQAIEQWSLEKVPKKRMLLPEEVSTC